jgi:hypothetical protein
MSLIGRRIVNGEERRNERHLPIEFYEGALKPDDECAKHGIRALPLKTNEASGSPLHTATRAYAEQAEPDGRRG